MSQYLSREEVAEMSFEILDLFVMLGMVRPADAFERRKGEGFAIAVAHSCFCDDCQEYLTEKGEPLVQEKLTDDEFIALEERTPDLPDFGGHVDHSA